LPTRRHKTATLRAAYGRLAVFAALANATVGVQMAAADAEWISLFDGTTLDGWRANEAPESFVVEDDAIVARGAPRSHLFYVGEGAPFRDFELELEVRTGPRSNSGVYFHTRYQDTGWPHEGFEVQINATHSDRSKTGSLYHVVDVRNSPVRDGEWFQYRVRVEGRRVQIQVNDVTTVDYTEPEGKKAGQRFAHLLGEGTFALQAHDPRSVVAFRNLRVRPITRPPAGSDPPSRGDAP